MPRRPGMNPSQKQIGLPACLALAVVCCCSSCGKKAPSNTTGQTPAADAEHVGIDHGALPQYEIELMPGEIVGVPFEDRNAASGGALFEQLSPEHTGIDFVLSIPDLRQNMREMMRLATYGGLCSGDYDGDGLIDLYVCDPAGTNRLYRNLGDLQFEDVTQAAGLHDPAFWGTGATFVDIDNDGDLDLFACGYRQANRVFINTGRDDQGRVRFVDRAEALGLDQVRASMTVAFADTDNDGDLDAYLATTGRAPEPGTDLTLPRDASGYPVVTEALSEVWMVTRYGDGKFNVSEAGQRDHLFRNDGGRFTEVTRDAGLGGAFFTLSAVWFDYNADGLPDLYASNDYIGPDQLYRNNGDGTFTDVIEQLMPYTSWFSMGADIGDINNDGRMDLFTTDMSATTHYRSKIGMGDMATFAWFLDSASPRQYMKNGLFINSGLDRMIESSSMSGIQSTNWSWAGRIEDYDNDGRVDVLVTNGAFRDAMHSDNTKFADTELGVGTEAWIDYWIDQPMLKERNLAFRNVDGEVFDNVSDDWGFNREGVSFGSVAADLDNDGDLDVVVVNADEALAVYRNNQDAGRRGLRVRLRGTRSNRYGLGATVRVRSANGEQVRYLTQTRGWLSSGDPSVHFGLGEVQSIEQLEIQWPSGAVQVFYGLPTEQSYTVCEPDFPDHASARPRPPGSDAPMLTASASTVRVRHEETVFDDFQRQPLLPNKLSQLGPGIALADYDGDGDDDLFVGGAAGHPGRIYQLVGSEYRLDPVFSQALQAHSASEDMGALWIDVEGDGDLDLYVVSGGVECEPGAAVLRDRLYINEGLSNGLRLAAGDAVPVDGISGSCVVAADYDRDGDLDLFVGGRAVPGAYPLAPPSRLLRNDSEGRQPRLTDVTAEAAPGLLDAGMVTGALWTDANGDGLPDLMLTVEWGPVRLFQNTGTTLVEMTRQAGLGDRLGWWNSIAGTDLDHDGDIDYVVTNFGLNTKYHPGFDHPYRIYFADFDGDGHRDIVEAKSKDDHLLPVRGFS